MFKVIKRFSGVPDGQIYPREFMPGDQVHGELAAVAVAQGWAEQVAEAPQPKKPGKS